MSLQTRITAFAQGVAADIKTLRTAQGILSNLSTTEKGSLVAAINEIVANSESGVTESHITTAINSLRTELRGAAGSALDTFAELEAAINADSSFASTIATALGLKINADLIGDTDRNFLTDYTTARDS